MTETQNHPGVDREHLRNYEQLHRSTTDRKVAGVAGGLGRHLNIDPTILRVLFVVLCFFGGAGFLLYGVAWLLVPEDGAPSGKIAMNPNTRNGFLIVAGIVAACILLANGWNGVGFPWPVFLVGIGVAVYLLLRDQRPTPPTYAGQPGGPVYGPPTAQQAGVTSPPAGYSTGYPTGDQSGGGTPPPAPPWLAPPPPPAPVQPPRKRGPKLFGPTLALLAIALGALGIYDAAGGTVVDAAYPALALTVVGLMLVVGAFVGRAGGLIFLGLVAAFALAVSSAVGSVRDIGGRGERLNAAPTSASQVEASYDLHGSGRMVVDLSQVSDPGQLDGRTIDLDANAGEIVLVLPDGITSDVTADISGPGQIDTPDHSSGGFGTDLQGSFDNDGSGTVTIRTQLSAGHIDVRNP